MSHKGEDGVAELLLSVLRNCVKIKVADCRRSFFRAQRLGAAKDNEIIR